MPEVSVVIEHPSMEPREAYSIIRDFRRYPDQTDAVRAVSIEQEDDGHCTSRWEVNFRAGILKWTERDSFSEEPDGRYRIDFDQTEGDPDHFSGAWVIAPWNGGTRVEFEARVELGMATLSHIIDPIAVRTLYENVVIIARGLLGAEAEVLTRAPEPVPWAGHSDGGS